MLRWEGTTNMLCSQTNFYKLRLIISGQACKHFNPGLRWGNVTSSTLDTRGMLRQCLHHGMKELFKEILTAEKSQMCQTVCRPSSPAALIKFTPQMSSWLLSTSRTNTRGLSCGQQHGPPLLSLTGSATLSHTNTHIQLRTDEHDLFTNRLNKTSVTLSQLLVFQ